MAERAFVLELRVHARTSHPPREGGLTVAKDTLSRGSVQPFGESRQHHGDLMGRGFQTVQGGVTSSTERGAARLTPERLDWFSLAMLAIPDERMDLSISIAEVHTLLIGTGKALGVHALGGSPSAFHPTPGA